MDTEPDPDIRFNIQGLFPASTNEDAWQRQYRTKGVFLDCNSKGKAKIRQSFENYDFDSPKGMLQYAGLPLRGFSTNADSLTGLTDFYELPKIGNLFNSRVFVKDEGQNPSGCFKDRETLVCLLKSRSNGNQSAVIYSSGNAAASAAIYTQDKPTRLISFVPGDTYPEKIEFIRDHGSDVVVVGDENTGFETGYRLYCQMEFSEMGHDDWSVRNQHRVIGDKSIAVEIAKQFPNEVPDYIIVPTANGSCLAGIWKGFKELHNLEIIDSLPKMLSVGVEKANPVYEAVQRKQTDTPFHCDISKANAKNLRMGSIIAAEEGYDSPQAAKAVLESGGTAVEVGWEEIQNSLELLLETEKQVSGDHDILPEPASLTALAALEKMNPKISGNVVLIHTGIGVKAEKKLLELLEERPFLTKHAKQILERQRKKRFPKTSKKGRRVDCKADLESMKKAFNSLSTKQFT